MTATDRRLISGHTFEPLSPRDDVCQHAELDQDSAPCGWPAADHLSEQPPLVIDLADAGDYRRDSYGLLMESTTAHMIAGRDVHNRGFRHLIQVWENRPSKARGADPDQLVTPHGDPTTERYSVTTSPQATIISARPDPTRVPDGPALAIDQEVELRVHGYSIGVFAIRSKFLHNPVLERVSPNGLAH
jgi:hypothetical protein